MARWRSNKDFLSTCLDHDLVPKGLRERAGGDGRRRERLRQRHERERVRVEAAEARSAFFRTRAELDGALGRLREVAGEQAAAVEGEGHRAYQRLLASKSATKQRKFLLLLHEHPPSIHGRGRGAHRPPLPSTTMATRVINLSGKPLEEPQKELLSLGTKYAFPPQRVPVKDLVVRCQHAADTAVKEAGRLGVRSEDVAEFKNAASRALKRACLRPLPTLPPRLQAARECLRKDRERVVVPADKARAVVVMRTGDYMAALERSLDPVLYEELAADPCPRYNRAFTADLLSAFIDGCPGPPPGPRVRRDHWLWREHPVRARSFASLRKTHGRPGAFYGLAKTHKWEKQPETTEEVEECARSIKLRPIAPGFRAIDAPMCRHLTACLQALARPRLSVQSPLEVLEVLEQHRASAVNCELVSFDVEGMYPNIPADEAVDIAVRRWEEEPECLEGLSVLTPAQLGYFMRASNNNTVVAITGTTGVTRYFRQRYGLAMGKSYAPVLADVYMGHWESDLEERARRAGGEVVFARRYMDDYVLGWRGSDESLSALIADLNTKCPSIRITCERETDSRLPFLDIMIQRTPDGFKTSVYKKACATDQAIPYSSFSDRRYLRGAVRADVLRAIRYIKDEGERQDELGIIHRKFSANGYPHSFIRRVVASTIHSFDRNGERREDARVETDIRMSIPFAGPVTYELSRLGRGIRIAFVSKPISTLGAVLCSSQKHKLPKAQQSELVYGIHCSCGGYYVGETGREVGERLKEHKAGWERHQASSAFGTIAHRDCEPSFNIEDVTILGREKKDQLRRLHESAHIRTVGRVNTIIRSPNDDAINRQAGLDLDELWMPLLFEAVSE